MKKILISLFISTLLTSTAVFADTVANPINTDILTMSDNTDINTIIETHTNVKNIDTENAQIEVETDNGENKIYTYSIKTIFVDGSTGEIVSPESIKKNDNIIVYHAPMQTFSIPPQSPAYAIFTNVEQGIGSFFVEVSDVKATKNGYIIEEISGKYNISINKETPISSYPTKNIVSMEDIEIGDRILFNTDILSASIPAVANPTNIILIKSSNNEKENILNHIILKNNITEQEIDGIKMLPLRIIAENLGYIVDWNNDTKSIIISKDAKSYTMTIDNDIYGYNKAITTYESAPKLINGLTYVPIDFIKDILN